MLIVEGTDLAGKTTFCKAIIENLNRRGYSHIYRHLSRLPESWDSYHDYLRIASPIGVHDRFHDSELAYCHGRREESKLTPLHYRLLEGQLTQLGMFKVAILPTNTLLAARYEALGDDMYGLDVIRRANDWFHRVSDEDGPQLFSISIYTHEEQPFPTKEEVRVTADAYVKHLEQTKAILR